MRRYLIASCLVLVVFGLFSATQAQADTIDNFTYQAGGNTFEWQLPSSPTVDTSFPGGSFDILNVLYSENGSPQNPADLSFFSNPGTPGFGGFFLADILQGISVVATGPQLYTGLESAPTFLTGTFSLIDISGGNGIPATLTIASVPEPSSLMLLGTGMFALLGFALKKAIVYRHNASNMIVA